MENVRHEKEEEGIFYGAFSYMTEGIFAGLYEAKCSQACINIILQANRFVDGIAVSMDEQALKQTIDVLHIAKYFGLSNVSEMENLFLVNWRPGDLEVFGSLLAIYQVLKSEQLTLLPLTANLHPSVSSATSSPENMKGYLYFLDSHWMVLRQLGNQWYKFDPWLAGPQLLKHFYVSLYIKQLLADGNLLFLIEGNFPQCPADIEIPPEEEIPIPEAPNQDAEGKASIDLTEQELAENLRFLDLVFENEDNELALALVLSLEDRIRVTKDEEALATKFLSSSGGLASALQPPLMNRREECSVEGSSTQNNVKRKNGTAVNPLTVYENLNESSDGDDLFVPFSIMFNEPGEGARCLASPESCVGSPGPCVGSPASTPSPQPSTSSDPAPAPSVTISSSELSSFKKAVARGEEKVVSAVKEKSSIEEDNCCVCWAEAPSHVVVPCGHFCLCSSCYISILKPQPDKSFCPLCKQEATSIIKLYK